MAVKQISVFLENEPTRVAEVTKTLAKAGVDISALVLSDTIDFGVLRLIVNDNEKAYKVLKENSFIVRLSEVIVVPIAHDTGSLSKVLEVFADDKISIEYMYAFLGKNHGEAFSVFKMEDLGRAKAILDSHGIKRICENEL